MKLDERYLKNKNIKKIYMYIFFILTILTISNNLNALESKNECESYPDSNAIESSYLLTKEECEAINKFADNVEIEKAIGQLFMVNLHVNHIHSLGRVDHTLSTKKNKIPLPHIKLIQEQGFGSVILKKSNFTNGKSVNYTEEERIGRVKEFTNILQYRALQSKGIKIPLIIAADFEGPSTSSVSTALTSPPTSLSLAMTQDVTQIEEFGKIVGYQLAGSGINMILGPVLDLDRNISDKNSVLGNRVFSSDSEVISKVATFYTKGLREAGILVIGKHFPGLGSVEGDVEKQIVSFNTDGNELEELQEHLKPYKSEELKNLLTGVMTSHVAIPFLTDKENYEPATFRKNVISLIRSDDKEVFKKYPSLKGMNYHSKLIITDDMGMGGITKHIDKDLKISANKRNNLKRNSFAAIRAFEAGHDIILFNKVVKNNADYKKGDILVDTLIEVKNKLLKHIKATDTRKKQFRNSLKRIFKVKASIYKMHGGKISNFVTNKINKVSKNRLSVPEFIGSTDGFINSTKIKNKYDAVFRKSYSLVGNNYPDLNIPAGFNTCIFSPTKLIENYKKLEPSPFNKVNITDASHNKKPGFQEQKKLANKFLEEKKCGLIFFIINEAENLDRLQNIISYLKSRDLTPSINVLLHMSPNSLKKLYKVQYPKLAIMGNFTTHELSYETDLLIINSMINEGLTLENKLTIDINDVKASVSNIKNTSLPKEITKLNYFFKKEINQKEWTKLHSFSKDVEDSLINKYEEKLVFLDNSILPKEEQDQIKVKTIINNINSKNITKIVDLLKEVDDEIKLLKNQENNQSILFQTYYKAFAFMNINQKEGDLLKEKNKEIENLNASILEFKKSISENEKKKNELKANLKISRNTIKTLGDTIETDKETVKHLKENKTMQETELAKRNTRIKVVEAERDGKKDENIILAAQIVTKNNDIEVFKDNIREYKITIAENDIEVKRLNTVIGGLENQSNGDRQEERGFYFLLFILMLLVNSMILLLKITDSIRLKKINSKNAKDIMILLVSPILTSPLILISIFFLAVTFYLMLQFMSGDPLSDISKNILQNINNIIK